MGDVPYHQVIEDVPDLSVMKELFNQLVMVEGQGHLVLTDQGRLVSADQGHLILTDQGHLVSTDQGHLVLTDQGHQISGESLSHQIFQDLSLRNLVKGPGH